MVYYYWYVCMLLIVPTKSSKYVTYTIKKKKNLPIPSGALYVFIYWVDSCTLARVFMRMLAICEAVPAARSSDLITRARAGMKRWVLKDTRLKNYDKMRWIHPSTRHKASKSFPLQQVGSALRFDFYSICAQVSF